MAQTYTFSPVTATDRAGLVWVAAILSLMFSVLTLMTRFGLKLHSLGNDDWVLAAATLVAVGQYVAVYVGLHLGVGKSSALLTASYARALGEDVLASEVLFVVALALSKLSVVFFMKRLFTPSHRVAWWCCNAAAATTVVWGIASALGISVGCGPSHILYGSRRCSGKLLRWTLVISTDALLEIAYVGLALVLVWPLRMKRYIKITVVCAFACRLICALFATLHGISIAKYVTSADPGLAIANVLVWQQIELGYALFATTIPTLKGFVRGYTKAMGENGPHGRQRLGGGYNLGSHNQPSNSSKSRSHDASRFCENEGEVLQLRPHVGGYRVGAFHDSSRAHAVGRLTNSASGDGENPFIWRNISVSVEHERTSRANSHVQLMMNGR